MSFLSLIFFQTWLGSVLRGRNLTTMSVAQKKDSQAKDSGITPRGEDYSEWYFDVVRAADLAENSPVRGMMVIKPNGMASWEAIRDYLDRKIKETGP